MDVDTASDVSATVPDHVKFPTARPRWQQTLIDVAYPTVTFLVVTLIAEAWIRIAEVPRYILPTPSAAFTEMWDSRVFLLDQTWVTVQEIVYGYILAVLVAIPLAIAIATSRPVEKSIYPLLVASQVVPKVALAPVFLVWLGFGISSKVLIVLLISFFPIVVNAVIGLQSIETEKIYLAQSMGAGRWKTFWRIRLPQALPATFGGLKLAAIFAVVGAIVGEFIGADKGLGRTLLLASGNLNSALLFATIGYLTILGVLFFVAVDVLERVSIPWHVSKRGRRSS
jgi:NitT/TauT family transport system permease protein